MADPKQKQGYPRDDKKRGHRTFQRVMRTDPFRYRGASVIKYLAGKIDSRFIAAFHKLYFDFSYGFQPIARILVGSVAHQKPHQREDKTQAREQGTQGSS